MDRHEQFEMSKKFGGVFLQSVAASTGPWKNQKRSTSFRPLIRECEHCHGRHFTVDEDDNLIWACTESLRSSYAQCVAWNVWLDMRLKDPITDEEEAIITLALMCETYEQQLEVGKRLFDLRKKYETRENQGTPPEEDR